MICYKAAHKRRREFKMYDLIYCENRGDYTEIKNKLLDNFPNANIQDASDEIHHDRFEIEMDDDKRDDYLIFTMKEGFAVLSLTVQLMLHENQKELKELMGRAGLVDA
jgi:hypothetical protein